MVRPRGPQRNPRALSDFRNPVRTVAGRSSLRRLSQLLGQRDAIVVTTPGARRRGTLGRIESLLGPLSRAAYAGVSPNPTIADCIRAARELAAVPGEVVLIAVGGGSALDTAKVVTVLRDAAVSETDLGAHLRDGAPLSSALVPGPLIAVPTTAGTGSEATPFATVWDEQTGTKCSLAHPELFPEAALLDPELTVTLPQEVTVASALDALSHAMESIWNRNAGPISDLFACRAIEQLPDALERLLGSPSDLDLRQALQLASHFAGIAISSTRTALAHSVSYAMTSELGLPHGLAVSFTLPEVLRLNHSIAPERTRLVIRALGCRSLEAALERLRRLFRAVGLTQLVGAYVADAGALAGLKGQLLAPDRAGNNLAMLDEVGARQLLVTAFESLSRNGA